MTSSPLLQPMCYLLAPDLEYDFATFVACQTSCFQHMQQPQVYGMNEFASLHVHVCIHAVSRRCQPKGYHVFAQIMSPFLIYF